MDIIVCNNDNDLFIQEGDLFGKFFFNRVRQAGHIITFWADHTWAEFCQAFVIQNVAGQNHFHLGSLYLWTLLFAYDRYPDCGQRKLSFFWKEIFKAETTIYFDKNLKHTNKSWKWIFRIRSKGECMISLKWIGKGTPANKKLLLTDLIGNLISQFFASTFYFISVAIFCCDRI